MIGIIFATEREAAPFLARAGNSICRETTFPVSNPVPVDTAVVRAPNQVARDLRARAESLSDTSIPTFHDLRPAQALVVCICGMGPACARAGTDALLEKFGVTSIVNAGVAGAVVDCATVGEVFRVATACLWPAAETMFICRDDRWKSLLHVVLATVAEPVFDPMRKAEIAHDADIVDMEGAAIAQGCQARGVPVYLIKGVTDQAGANDRACLLRNLDTVSSAVADVLWQELLGAVTASPPATLVAGAKVR